MIQLIQLIQLIHGSLDQIHANPSLHSHTFSPCTLRNRCRRGHIPNWSCNLFTLGPPEDPFADIITLLSNRRGVNVCIASALKATAATRSRPTDPWNRSLDAWPGCSQSDTPGLHRVWDRLVLCDDAAPKAFRTAEGNRRSSPRIRRLCRRRHPGSYQVFRCHDFSREPRAPRSSVSCPDTPSNMLLLVD